MRGVQWCDANNIVCQYSGNPRAAVCCWLHRMVIGLCCVLVWRVPAQWLQSLLWLAPPATCCLRDQFYQLSCCGLQTAILFTPVSSCHITMVCICYYWQNLFYMFIIRIQHCCLLHVDVNSKSLKRGSSHKIFISSNFQVGTTLEHLQDLDFSKTCKYTFIVLMHVFK